MTRSIRVILLLLAAVSGCRAAQVASDHNQMRTKLLDLYTDQIMDNLVRGYNGLPIVQIDYSNLLGQVNTGASASLGGSQTVVDSRGVTNTVATGAMGATTTVAKVFSRGITDVLNFGGSATNSNQLSMTGTPLINNNDVYIAYLTFLADSDNLICSVEPPPEGAAHLCREYCGMYYWIPGDRRHQFFELSLATTVMRGQPLKLPKDFEVTVDSLLAQRVINETEGRYEVLLNLKAQSKLPNAEGILRLKLQGVDYEIATAWVDGEDLKRLKREDIKVPDHGKPGQLLYFLYSIKDIPFDPTQLAKELSEATVNVRLAGFTPSPPTVESLLESIKNDAMIIRSNQNAHIH